MIGRMIPRAAGLTLISAAIAACSGAPRSSAASASPTDVSRFLARVDETMLKLGIAQNRAGWTQQTSINDDTEAMAARRHGCNVAHEVRHAARRVHHGIRPTGGQADWLVANS
jgi:hypothetical protein